MVDEKSIECHCGFGKHEDFLPVYDQSNNMYFCQECIKLIGHEAPFSKEELNKVNAQKQYIFW